MQVVNLVLPVIIPAVAGVGMLLSFYLGRRSVLDRRDRLAEHLKQRLAAERAKLALAQSELRRERKQGWLAM